MKYLLIILLALLTVGCNPGISRSSQLELVAAWQECEAKHDACTFVVVPNHLLPKVVEILE